MNRIIETILNYDDYLKEAGKQFSQHEGYGIEPDALGVVLGCMNSQYGDWFEGQGCSWEDNFLLPTDGDYQFKFTSDTDVLMVRGDIRCIWEFKSEDLALMFKLRFGGAQ